MRPAAAGLAMARSPRRPPRLPAPARDSVKLKDPARLPLHRQGRDRPYRQPRHHHGQGGLRHRHQARRHVLRGRGASAGLSAARWSLSTRPRREDAGRRQGGRDRSDARAVRVQAARRRRGDRKNTWAAIQGRDKLKVTWDDGPNAAYSSDTYRAQLEAGGAQARQGGAQRGRCRRRPRRRREALEAEYYIPHLAHAHDGAAGGDRAHRRRQAARSGPAYSRRRRRGPHRRAPRPSRGQGDGPRDAAGRRLRPQVEAGLSRSRPRSCRKAMDGAPVKVTWTREDDLHNGYYHTVSVERIEAGLDAGGKADRVAASQRGADHRWRLFAPDPKHESPFELGMGLVNTPFAIPNLRIENPEAAAHTRIGWFRSVSNVPHAFAIQSFVAELAAAAGRDPKEYLLELIGPPRLIDPTAHRRRVEPRRGPEALPDRHRPPAPRDRDGGRRHRLGPQPAQGPRPRHRRPLQLRHLRRRGGGGRGRAMAGSRIPRVDIAVDCGPQVNPERVRSQMEGAVIMGVSLATLGEITFKNGRVEQSQLRQLRGHAHRRRAARDPRPPAAGERLDAAARRRRRTRRAAGRAGDRQRDLRRHRQAHPAAADPRPAARLSCRAIGARSQRPGALCRRRSTRGELLGATNALRSRMRSFRNGPTPDLICPCSSAQQMGFHASTRSQNASTHSSAAARLRNRSRVHPAVQHSNVSRVAPP